MLAQVTAGTMPPFGAVPAGDCVTPLPFKDDPTLSATELATLTAWVGAGAPAGDAATAAVAGASGIATSPARRTRSRRWAASRRRARAISSSAWSTTRSSPPTSG
jgi:hypothetical protein